MDNKIMSDFWRADQNILVILLQIQNSTTSLLAPPYVRAVRASLARAACALLALKKQAGPGGGGGGASCRAWSSSRRRTTTSEGGARC